MGKRDTTDDEANMRLATGGEEAVQEWLRQKVARTADPKQRAYNERLADVYDALVRDDFSTVQDLREQIGGTPREITAKLQQLQQLGVVSYDEPEWYVEE